MFRKSYAQVFDGDERWRGLPVPEGDRFAWEPTSTYIRQRAVLRRHAGRARADPRHPRRARPRACSATASPPITSRRRASIAQDEPGRRSTSVEHGVQPADFNSYGARRGNHEVMVRGTFANVRLKNQLAPGTEGPFTRPPARTARAMTIYDAVAEVRAPRASPLVVLAGKEYGSGSSRDWAAKGPRAARRPRRDRRELRAHPPLEPGRHGHPAAAVRCPDRTPASLGLTGKERYDIPGLGPTCLRS